MLFKSVSCLIKNHSEFAVYSKNTDWLLANICVKLLLVTTVKISESIFPKKLYSLAILELLQTTKFICCPFAIFKITPQRESSVTNGNDASETFIGAILTIFQLALLKCCQCFCDKFTNNTVGHSLGCFFKFTSCKTLHFLHLTKSINK